MLFYAHVDALVSSPVYQPSTSTLFPCDTLDVLFYNAAICRHFMSNFLSTITVQISKTSGSQPEA